MKKRLKEIQDITAKLYSRGKGLMSMKELEKIVGEIPVICDHGETSYDSRCKECK